MVCQWKMSRGGGLCLYGGEWRGMVHSMAIDWDKPIYEPQKQDNEDKYLPHQLDRETVYLIQFACRAIIFWVLFTMYAASVACLLQGIALDNGWLATGGILLGAFVVYAHRKMRSASVKW